MNLHEEITKLQTVVKSEFKKAAEATSLCRLDSICYRPNGKRNGAIEKLTEDYFYKTNEMPDGKALERLADLCLYEELTDMNEHKISQTEYPFLSERQFDRRDSKEIATGEKAMGMNATDGQRHDKPDRRQRTEYENRFVDKKARSRNIERKRRYAEFTKVQPVVVQKIGN